MTDPSLQPLLPHQGTMLSNIDEGENLAHMERGDLYYAFTPELVAARKRCSRAVNRLNNSGELSRREIAEFWKEYDTRQSLGLPSSPN